MNLRAINYGELVERRDRFVRLLRIATRRAKQNRQNADRNCNPQREHPRTLSENFAVESRDFQTSAS
jgi:DNA-directed RNA polymerase subunit K/omega